MTRSLGLATCLAWFAAAAAGCGRVTSDPAQSAPQAGASGVPAAGGGAGTGAASQGGSGGVGPAGAGSGGTGPGGAGSGGVHPGGAGSGGVGPGGASSGSAGDGGGSGMGPAGAAGSGPVVPMGPCLSYAASQPVVYGPEVNGQVVVWTGAGYALVGSETHESYPWEREWYDIEFVAVDLAGNTVATATPYETYEAGEYGLPVDVGRARVLDVARADDGFGVLWCSYDWDTWDGQLKFGRLDANGMAVIELQPLAIPCNWQLPARLIWNGSGFAAVWDQGSSLRFVEMDQDGALGSEIFEIATNGMTWNLELFFDQGRYGLFWEEAHAALDANRFLVLAPQTGPLGESLLLSDPEAYARGLSVTQVGDGYAALWEESQIGGEWQRMVLVELQAEPAAVAAYREIELAPVGALSANDYEYGALLVHEELIENRTARSYGFAVLSLDGVWQGQELPLLPNDGFPLMVDFEWHDAAFDLLYTVEVGDERRLAYVRVSCESY